MSKRVSRRRFLQVAGASSTAALLGLTACTPKTAEPTQAPAQPTTAPPTVPPPTATPAGPKILTVRLSTDMTNLDPASRPNGADDTLVAAIHSGLIRYAPGTFEWVKDLAESIEESPDGLSVTFKLRQGVKWHKGYGELTAEDVKFSYERFLDPEVGAVYKDDWLNLDHVEVIDKYQGKIVLKEPFAPLWTSTLPFNSGVVICKKYAEEVGLQKLATNPIGTGPYMFDEWIPEQRVVVKRNPDYYGDVPAFDEIRCIPITDDKAAEVALEAGELDFGEVGVDALPRFKANSKFGVWAGPSLQYNWIGMNVEHPKLQDINVRQAIRYAIDVPSILQAAYEGQVEPTYTLIPPGILGSWEDAPHYQRDVQKAKEFMEKAGVQSLDLRMDIEDKAEWRTWAEVAQQNLKEIGINLTINPMDSASYWEIGFGDKGKEVELFADSFGTVPDPSWVTMWFLCSQVGEWNWMRWCNQEFDDLHKRGVVTQDKSEREKIYIKMQQLYDEACHSVWITNGIRVFAYKPTLKPAVTTGGIVTQLSFFEPA